jgi:hypothetical protein
MLFRKKIAVYCENHMKHKMCGENAEFSAFKHVVLTVTTGLRKMKG